MTQTRRAPPPLDRESLDRLALRYVERFATSRAKLADYLRRKVRERGWDGPASDPKALADRFAELGYIDDRAFAEARARSMARRGLGERRIAVAFRAAGIEAEDAEAVDWSALTDEKMTVVVYMGMTAAASVRAGLLAAGRSPQTPVGVFARVTLDDAQAAVGTLNELPDLVGRIDRGPAILIIGDVVAHSAPWSLQNLHPMISKLLEAAE